MRNSYAGIVYTECGEQPFDAAQGQDTADRRREMADRLPAEAHSVAQIVFWKVSLGVGWETDIRNKWAI